MRSAFTHLTPTNNCKNLLDSQRQSRSQSLEPRATQEIRPIEHSKSARYNKNKRNTVIPPNELWNPKLQSMQFIKLQLENPLALTSVMNSSAEEERKKHQQRACSISQVKDEEFRHQLRKLVLNNNKQSDNFISLDNNLTEQGM